jgi:hypothetical protein
VPRFDKIIGGVLVNWNPKPRVRLARNRSRTLLARAPRPGSLVRRSLPFGRYFVRDLYLVANRASTSTSFTAILEAPFQQPFNSLSTALTKKSHEAPLLVLKAAACSWPRWSTSTSPHQGVDNLQPSAWMHLTPVKKPLGQKTAANASVCNFELK